jgi:uncharacterized protein (TIGR00251 family)
LSDGPLNRARDGLRVVIRLSPRGKADRLLAIAATAKGGRMIKAAVTAPPENGRANEALLQLLAQAWHVPRRDLSIVAGAASRNKTVHIAGDAQKLIEKITSQIAALPG